jgi:hypothetical protein
MNREEAIKLILNLFNVESKSEEETAVFQGASHEELLDALEYWIDQCKMIFGDVVIDNLQGFKDSGVDIGISLVRSNIRFGLQVKSHGDIEKPDFYTKVKSQAFESDSHSLEKYIILFGGDMNTQKTKVNGIIAELSQRNTDLRIITVPPEKLLTILMAYRNKTHPAKLIMLDISNATRIGLGLAENLSNEKRQAEIKINIKYLIDDGVERPHKFKLNYAFNINDIDKTMVPDEFEQVSITDDVLGMKKEEFERLTVSDDAGETKAEDILVFNEKLNRAIVFLQALSHDGKLRGQYLQVSDIFTENNIQKYVAMDIKKPLKFDIDIPLSTKIPTFHFNLQLGGSLISELYEMCTFLIHLRSATFIRLVIDCVGEHTFVTTKPMVIVPPPMVDLIFRLKRLEELSGYIFYYNVESNEELKKLLPSVIIATNLLLYHKMNPKEILDFKFTVPKEAALKIMRLYKEEKTNQDIFANIPMEILKKQIIIPKIAIHLSDFRLVNDINLIDDIEKSTVMDYEIKLEARKT